MVSKVEPLSISALDFLTPLEILRRGTWYFKNMVQKAKFLTGLTFWLFVVSLIAKEFNTTN